MRFFVLGLVGLLIGPAPVAEADDYAFLFPEEQTDAGAAAMRFMKPENSAAIAEDEPDVYDDCPCPLCMMTLGEWFALRIVPPQAAKALLSSTVRVVPSIYSPDIFHPPIV